MKHLFFRCNIQLDYPPITRLLLIEANSPLTNVHNIIQLAFELDNDKDFRFYQSSVPYILSETPKTPAQKKLVPISPELSLKELNLKSNTVLTYLYDSNNPFIFHIIVEKLCSANTDSTSPRLLESPEKESHANLEHPKKFFKNILGSEFF